MRFKKPSNETKRVEKRTLAEKNDLGTVKLASELRWETLGDEVVALDSDAGEVYRLSGDSAAVARHLLNGADHGLSNDDFVLAVEGLIARQLVTTTDEALTRRSMLRYAGAAVVGGITVLALPTAMAAASGGGGGDPAIGSNYTSDGVNASVLSPTNVSATPDDSQVTVSWNLVDGATSYRVYYRMTGSATYTLAWIGAGASTTISPLTNGTSYDFYVVAVDSPYVSAPSSSVSATPSGALLGTPVIQNLSLNSLSWT